MVRHFGNPGALSLAHEPMTRVEIDLHQGRRQKARRGIPFLDDPLAMLIVGAMGGVGIGALGFGLGLLIARALT